MNSIRRHLRATTPVLASAIAIASLGGCDDGYNGSRGKEVSHNRHAVVRKVNDVISPDAPTSTTIPYEGIPAIKLSRNQIREKNAAIKTAEEQKRIEALNKFTGFEADFCIGDRTDTKDDSGDLEMRYSRIEVVTRDAVASEIVPTANFFDGSADDDVHLGGSSTVRLYRPDDSTLPKGDRGKIYIHNTHAGERNLCGYSAIPVGKSDSIALRASSGNDELVRTTDFSLALNALPKCREECAQVKTRMDNAGSQCQTAYDRCIGNVNDAKAGLSERLLRSNLSEEQTIRAEARIEDAFTPKEEACFKALTKCKSKQPDWHKLAQKALAN